MSITVLYRGRNVRLSYSLRKRQVISSLVVLFSLFFVAGRSINTPSENSLRIDMTQSALALQQTEVEALKQQTQDQLLGLMMKVAEAESRLHRVNALSQELVEQAGLSTEEFQLSSQLPVGGPSTNADLPVITATPQVLESIDSVILSIEDKQKQLELLESIMLGHHISDESAIAGRPVKSGWLSSYFGIRKDPFNGLPAMHHGIDFAGKEGDPVVATGAGIVVWSGERYGYGNLIELDHGAGIRTRYAHNKSLSVNVGEVVTKGQVVAVMGSTGRSTGAHVHYEVLKNGVQQDPLFYVSRRK